MRKSRHFHFQSRASKRNCDKRSNFAPGVLPELSELPRFQPFLGSLRASTGLFRSLSVLGVGVCGGLRYTSAATRLEQFGSKADGNLGEEREPLGMSESLHMTAGVDRHDEPALHSAGNSSAAHSVAHDGGSRSRCVCAAESCPAAREGVCPADRRRQFGLRGCGRGARVAVRYGGSHHGPAVGC